MTQEPLALAPTQPPAVERGDPPSIPVELETAAGADAPENPVCPPVAEAAANRANASAPEDPEAAPGPVITPDAGADLPGYVFNRG